MLQPSNMTDAGQFNPLLIGQGINEENGFGRNVRDDEFENLSGSENGPEGISEDDDGQDDNKKNKNKRRRYHRHTQHQIQTMEAWAFL